MYERPQKVVGGVRIVWFNGGRELLRPVTEVSALWRPHYEVGVKACGWLWYRRRLDARKKIGTVEAGVVYSDC